MSFGGAAKNTIPYKKAAAAAAVQKRAALKAMAPARSALVRQKGVAAKNLQPVKGDLGNLRKGVKNVLGQDAAKAKKAAAPATNLAKK